MATKDTLFSELTELEKAYPGLLASLKACNTKMLQALQVGHVVYSAAKLTKEEQAEKAKLEQAITLFGADSDMGKFAQKQIDNLTGDRTGKAWQAYRAHMRPTNTSSAKRKGLPDNCVVRCPFADDTLFVVVRNKAGSVYKLEGTKAVLVPSHKHLSGFAKVLESLTAARRLAHAQKNNGVPADCKDGVGVRKDGFVGGTLAHVVSEEPTAWLDNPANMPLLPKEDAPKEDAPKEDAPNQ